MLIRPARPEDARAIATIHVHSWQAAYQDIVPAAFLGSLSVDDRERAWRENLEQATSQVRVAEESGSVLGWISVARSRDADARESTGEILALYVDPSQWRRRIGHHLWSEAARTLTDSGFAEVTLWVLEKNTRAILFYRTIGFMVDPGREKTIERGGATLLEIRMRRRLDE